MTANERNACFTNHFTNTARRDLALRIRTGNEISLAQRSGWSKVDTVFSLKFAFRKDHQNEFEGVGFNRNTDSHYPLIDSYSYICALRREAVEALF